MCGVAEMERESRVSVCGVAEMERERVGRRIGGNMMLKEEYLQLTTFNVNEWI